MRLYLDTSALVKLYVAEPGSEDVRQAVAEAEIAATSSLAYVEARAAFARRRRERSLIPLDYRRVLRSFEQDWPRYLRVEVTGPVIGQAARLAERHALQAYDAVHLASALTLRARLGPPVAFLSWDAAQQAAARRERLIHA